MFFPAAVAVVVPVACPPPPTDACPLLSPSADGKGSRLLTANEHWKSQIRHALYTSPRFKRVDDGEAWSVSNPEAKAPEPVTVGKRPLVPPVPLSLPLPFFFFFFFTFSFPCPMSPPLSLKCAND